jgi:DNA end-binding protein Ku
MPRAMWSGAISFGLVNVPIKMYTAARSQDVRFNQLHEPDMSRVRLKKFCAVEDIEVPADEIVRGYAVGKDQYVVITDEEMEALAPNVTSGIEIEEFVNLSDIDPVFFESSYYLVPEKNGTKAYALLLNAMEKAQRIALGRVVLRNKQYLVAIRPAGRALAMSTLYYPDEVVQQEELDGLPAENVEASEREMAMAQQLIDALSNPFEPEKYHDEYRDQLMELIDRKADGAEVVEMPERPAATANVTDLMAALEASIAAAKQTKSA